MGIFFFSVNKFPQNFVFYKIATKFRAFSTSFQKFDRYFSDFYNRVSKKAKKKQNHKTYNFDVKKNFTLVDVDSAW